MNVSFSVIIRCFNEERHLPVLLKSIENQSLKPEEVLLVDSGSTDSSVRIAEDHGARVLHIRQEEFSFGRSLNLGAEAARGEFLVIASAHVYPTTARWFEFLLKPFEDQRVALVYGGQCGDQTTKYSERQIFKQWFPPVSVSDQTHAFCNNGNAAVRRSVWETLRYDEHVPGLEDVHWANRAIERGLAVTYRADAQVAHVHNESYLQVSRRYRREAIGFRSVYPWEGMTLSQACRLCFSSIRLDLLEARRDGVLVEVFGSVIRFRISQFWGAYRGMKWQGFLTNDLKVRLYFPGTSLERRQGNATADRPLAPKDAE
jgi:rhamnosyltransferase